MNTEKILELLKKTILDTVPNISQTDIVLETSLSDLGIDSIKTVELIIRLEETFGEEITFDDWLDQEREKDIIPTFIVKDLVSYIKEKLA